MHTVYLGLGANLGNREATIGCAIEMIGEQVGTVEARSALYYSEPWGFQSENGFANAVVRVATMLSPMQLLEATQAIERQLGKDGNHATERHNGQHEYHDRPIDIDILLYDDLTIDTPRLTIPHPLMRQRPFVMEPLREVMPVSTVLLSTTYFGPVQWYQKLNRYARVLIEEHENFQKQTYRNRCLIATTQGVQALTVPVTHDTAPAGSSQPTAVSIRSVRLSDHGNWRRLHWQAIQSAYGESPFFEYYEDDIRPFFTERNWEMLTDYNDAICRKMCELLDIHPHMERTSEFMPTDIPGTRDMRSAIRPKHPLFDPDFTPRPYYQVFRQKHGFMPNLSIIDLLMNMGPESIFYVENLTHD